MTETSEGWRAGDLAVCIVATPWWRPNGEPVCGPSKDQVVRVSAVDAFAECENGIAIALTFHEFGDERYPASPYFRRVEPDHSAADDAEIIALIKGARVGARA